MTVSIKCYPLKTTVSGHDHFSLAMMPSPIFCTVHLQIFHWAQSNAEYIVPLYCFDPRHYVGTYNYNLPKTGPFRLRFLLESIRDLRNALLNKGR